MPGDHTEGDTPDPIPNSVVKPLWANGSDSARDRESRSVPAFFLSPDHPCLLLQSRILAYAFALDRLAYRLGYAALPSARFGTDFAISPRNQGWSGEGQWYETAAPRDPSTRPHPAQFHFKTSGGWRKAMNRTNAGAAWGKRLNRMHGACLGRRFCFWD